jgi:dipeptidyl aminopeptidase/acylaminoacyl peptidase
MQARIRISSIALAALSLLPSLAVAVPSVEAYGRLPSIEDVQISPDGRKLAFVRTDAESRILFVTTIDDHKILGKVRLGDTRLRAVRWADDAHVLLTTASNVLPMELEGERTEWNLMQVFDLTSNKIQRLLEHAPNDGTETMNVVYGMPVVRRDGKDTLVMIHGLYVDSPHLCPALFEVNLGNGRTRILRKGTRATRNWLIDDGGEIVAENAYVESARRWEIHLYRNGRPQQTVSGTAAIDEPDLLGLTGTGNAILTALTADGDVTWKPLYLKDGSWGEDIAPGKSLNAVIWEPGSRRLIGTASLKDETHYYFDDPALQESWNWITRVLGRDRVELVSMSADHSRIVVEVFGPTRGYSYQLADVGEHFIEPIGKAYEEVGEIAEVRRIDYAAGDGLKIPAYLTLPPGYAPKALPLIVFPHGGPQASDSLDFDWWAQAMAAQGYAVLQPNYRGSSLSEKWTAAGYGEWGRKMQTDLSDGVRYLAEQGIVDPKRVCVVGGSYGGYAALAGVTIQTGIYRCAVAVAAVSNLESFVSWSGYKSGSMSTRYWDRFLGIEGARDKALDAISPIRHVDRISVPIMLIHGKDDVTVPYDQSTDFATAMKRAGKPFEFVTLAKEDHYLSRSATRLQMLNASVEFLRRNNPPDPPGPVDHTVAAR